MKRVEMTAEFPLVRYAVAFVERYSGRSSESEPMVQKGRKVTWAVEVADLGREREYLTDLMENVGYVGSSPSRRARLNGLSCPVSY